MSRRTPSVFDRLRQPAYTGENRCLPCTVTNIGIAGVGSVGLAVVAAEFATILPGLALALVSFGVSVALIYFRGYLVPGTPWFTQRFFPEPVLALFGKANTREAAIALSATKLEALREGRVDPEALLTDNDVLERRDAGLAFTPAFEVTLDTELRRARSEATDPDDHEVPFDHETLATLCDSEPSAIAYQEREIPAFEVGYRVRKWPSQTALLADVATDRALRGGDSEWADAPLEQRLKLLDALRLFHETCPDCGGALERVEKKSSACCLSGEGSIVARECRDCGQSLFERSENTNDWMPFDEAAPDN
jgi:hypothetical protein